jgi:stage III sporulation protein AG
MNKLFDGKKLTLKKIGVEKLIVLLILGVFLLIISQPLFNEEEDPSTPQETFIPTLDVVNEEDTSYEKVLEEKLKEVLSKIDGVGKVEVMLTLKSSKELIVNKDQPYSTSQIEEQDSEGGTRKSTDRQFQESTILINGSEGSNVPFVIKELEPEISGVVIIAEGGDNPSIKSDLTNAAEVLFNIPVHRIKVMKMVTN